MKQLIDYFAKRGKIFKNIVQENKTELKIRKKVIIFTGTDVDGNYHAMYVVQQKSRFLLKDVESLVEIDQIVQEAKGHNFRYKHFLRSAQICSKSKESLQNRGWKIHNDFM